MNPEWVAGFFDGEGCVAVYGHPSEGGGRRHSLRVQLVQVDSPATDRLLNQFKANYGGGITHQTTSSGRGKLNWYVSGDDAARFLEGIVDLLVLKSEQAQIGIAWHRNRPAQRRDARGRILRSDPSVTAFNDSVANLMAQLKRKSIDQVMADQKDLVEVVATLRQILNLKGL